MRILLIAPKCYPVNGAEAIVNIKLLRAMTEDGNFEVDLISRRNSMIDYPSDSLESYGVKLRGLYVIDNKGGFNLKVLWETIRSLFIFKAAFPGCHWAVRALPLVKKLARENHYDFVLTKNSPSLLLASYLKKRNNMKWVASWNDPYPPSFYPAPYGKGVSHNPSLWEYLQLRLMRLADYHVFPSRALKDHMVKYLHVCNEKCQVAPHVVFEEKNGVHPIPRRVNNKGALTIIHSGNLEAPRDPIPFINAFRRIIRTRPEGMIHLTLLGKLGTKEKVYIENASELKHCVEIVSTVEYKKSLEILNEHDVACVIEADCGVGGGVFLPTKVTDFMQMHKPILAVSPRKGVLEDLYNDGAIGYFSDIHNEETIYQALLKIIDDYSNNALINSSIPDSFRPKSVVSVYKEIYYQIKSQQPH
mgnify:CR=1 FL=1